ncbi:MAG: hypothetical protein J7L90_01200 [Dehalococcoidia bacterium]|nr:hypothetical protein [Dehalococcoidia bacterium]
MGNHYRILGLGLAVAGAVFTPVSYFLIKSVPMTAIGISMLILGFTCIALANSRPYISPEACQVMLKTGMENTAALLEELGLRNKAIYLPSAMRDGRPQALIPLQDNEDIVRVQGKLAGRMIVRYGASPDDLAIAVTTPGSINMDMLEGKPGPTADEIEESISYIVVGLLDLASSVEVNMLDGRVNVEIKDASLAYEDIWYYRCLGSPLASIAAAVSCEAMDKPVRVAKESYDGGKCRIELEVLS